MMKSVELNFFSIGWESNQIFMYMLCISLMAVSSCHLVKASKFKRAENQNSCLVHSPHDLKPFNSEGNVLRC